jgi:hypothetical protein
MYAIEFTRIDGTTVTKYFKTFKGAKKHFDSYKTKEHFWFYITMGKIKQNDI